MYVCVSVQTIGTVRIVRSRVCVCVCVCVSVSECVCVCKRSESFESFGIGGYLEDVVRREVEQATRAGDVGDERRLVEGATATTTTTTVPSSGSEGGRGRSEAGSGLDETRHENDDERAPRRSARRCTWTSPSGSRRRPSARSRASRRRGRCSACRSRTPPTRAPSCRARPVGVRCDGAG